MKGIRALLPLTFILFFSLSATDLDGIKYTEKPGPSAGGLLTDMTEGKICLSRDGEYRDGIIDNYNFFINPEYPPDYIQTAGNTGSG